MKTGPNSFFLGWMICSCLVLSTMTAHCQTGGGIIAQDGIRLSGEETIDSFNSADPDHSIWQSNCVFRSNYFSPGINYGIWSNSLSFVSNSFPSRTADVTVFTGSNVLLLGSSTVAGYALTGPNGTLDSGANGTVGDLAWCFGSTGPGGGETGIEPGHSEPGPNFNSHSNPLPTPVNPVNGWMNWSNVPSPPVNTAIRIGGTWMPTNGTWRCFGGTLYTNTGSGFTIGGITYPLVITNRPENTNWVFYSRGSLTQNIFVDAQYVVLYLTNGWSYSGVDTFTLNTNADIKILSTGNISSSGESVINNLGNYAHAFSLYDVAGYPISVSLTGNAAPAGFYYLPSSTIALSGGGMTGDFVGAIVCFDFQDPGHMNIHFDESLATLLSPWIIQQPTNQIVQTNSEATFNVDADGSGLGYQWFFSDGGTTNLIPGAVESSLTLTNVQPANQGNYFVVITNSSGSVASSPASLILYTNAAATLSGTFNFTNGTFQFNVTGIAGLNYTVEASTNLVNWIPLWTNASPFSLVDSNASPQRFYRAVFFQ